MCVKLRRQGGKIVGIELNFKRTVVFMASLATVLGSAAAIKFQCNNGIAYAQEVIVKQAAVEVFDSLHRPFEGRLCKTDTTLMVLIEMMKMANADKPELYRNAKNAVTNSGRFVDQ